MAYKTVDVSSASDKASELNWYIITLYPLIDGDTDFRIVRCVAENGLFPEEDLFPTSDNPEEETLCPYFGEWDKIRNEVN